DDRSIAERLEADDLDSFDAHGAPCRRDGPPGAPAACQGPMTLAHAYHASVDAASALTPPRVRSCYHAGVRWAVLLVLLGVARATPTVEIRAHTQLSLGHVKLTDNGIEVIGHLSDKLTGAGLARQSVRVTVGDETRTVTTDDNGAFAEVFPSEGGTVDVKLGFTGSGRLEKVTPLTVTTDPSQSQIELAILTTVHRPPG